MRVIGRWADVGIKQALVTKISRERVGDEIDKMLKGTFSLLSSVSSGAI